MKAQHCPIKRVKQLIYVRIEDLLSIQVSNVAKVTPRREGFDSPLDGNILRRRLEFSRGGLK